MMMSLLTSIHVEVYAIVFVSSSSCSITRRKIAIFIYYFYLLLYSYLLHSCLTIMFIMFISSYWILDRCLDRTESVCSTFSYALSYYVVEYYLNIFYDERQAKYNLSLRLRNLPKRRETKNLFVLSFRIILSSICLQRTLFISSYLMPVRSAMNLENELSLTDLPDFWLKCAFLKRRPCGVRVFPESDTINRQSL